MNDTLYQTVMYQKSLLIAEVIRNFLERDPGEEDQKKFSFQVEKGSPINREYIAFCGIVFGEIRMEIKETGDYYKTKWIFTPKS